MIAGAVALVAVTVPVYPAARLRVHAAARRGRAPLHADHAARHLGRPRRSACCRRRTSILTQLPEVERVFGKAGRAETSTDPAPLSMMETTVVLKPQVRVAHGDHAGTRDWAPDVD